MSQLREKQVALYPQHFEVYLPTDEDWHPSFPGSKLRVRVYSYDYEQHSKVLVCVWGADDTGMELWLECPLDKREQFVAAAIFNVGMFDLPLRRAWLESQGFRPA